MKLIPLTQGLFTKVDDEDYEYLIKYKWFAHYSKSTDTYYVQHVEKGKCLHMHREIMKTPDWLFADHIDGDTLNNQKSNLRNCTRQENNRNKRKKTVYGSKYKGVNKRSENRYISKIKVNEKSTIIGTFKTEKEAAIAYNEKALLIFGEFANLNIIE